MLNVHKYTRLNQRKNVSFCLTVYLISTQSWSEMKLMKWNMNKTREILHDIHECLIVHGPNSRMIRSIEKSLAILNHRDLESGGTTE